MPMTPAQQERLRYLLSSLNPGALICALRLVEAIQQRDQPATLTRAWLIEEAERRWPAASTAVDQAFDEDGERAQAGIDGPEVDYVGVLLAHVPAEVLAAAPAELPALLRPVFDGLGVPITGRPATAALPTAGSLPAGPTRAREEHPMTAPATPPPVGHNGTAEHPCTECGHLGTGQVPGCSCQGCDDETSRRLA